MQIHFTGSFIALCSCVFAAPWMARRVCIQAVLRKCTALGWGGCAMGLRELVARATIRGRCHLQVRMCSYLHVCCGAIVNTARSTPAGDEITDY